MSTRRLNDPKFLQFHAPLNGHAEDVIRAKNGTWVGESYVEDTRGRQVADFDGSDDTIDFAAIGTIRSVSFWVKPTSTTEEMLKVDTSKSIDISTGTITYTGLTATQTYVNGKVSTTLVAGLDQHVVCVLNADVSAANFEAATDGSGFGQISMGELRAYNVALTQTEAFALYRQDQRFPVQIPVEQPIPALPDLTDSALEGAWLNKKVVGTGKDYSTKGNDATASDGPVHDVVGATFDGAGARFVAGDINALDGLTTVTACAWVNHRVTQAGQTVIIQKGSGWQLHLGDNLPKWKVYAGDGSEGQSTQIASPTSGDFGRWYFVVGTYDGTTLKLYVDGVLITSTSPANNGAIGSAGNAVTIGAFSGAAERLDGSVRDPRAYSEVKNQSWITHEYRKGVPDDSLVLHVTDGTRDLSRYRNTLTASGGIILGRRMSLDGTDDKLDCGDVGNVRTIAFWVKPNSTSEEMLLLDTSKDIGIVSGTITYTGLAATATYVNGVASTTLAAGYWQRVLVVLNADVDANNFEIGTDGTNFGQIDVDDLSAWDEVKTAGFAKLDYLQKRVAL